MNTHEKATDFIEAALKLATNTPGERYLVMSSAAYTAISLAHTLKAIDGAEYLNYCERLRQIDARWLALPELRHGT
jgi:hypothetical protein